MDPAAEEHFTSRSMVDVRELKENNPDFALVLDTKDDKLPNTFDLAYKRIPVHDVTVGSYILVGAGEVIFLKICCLVIILKFEWVQCNFDFLQILEEG